MKIEKVMCYTVEEFIKEVDRHYAEGHNPIVRGRTLFVYGFPAAELVSTSNNPEGRPYKGKERRQNATFRLQPSTIRKIKDIAKKKDISQSDVIEGLVEEA